VGWLSRFSREGSEVPGFDIVATVSGPEPQRQRFADQLKRELAASGRRALLVTGQLTTDFLEQVGQLEVVNHLPAKEMEAALRGASVVIARSGYSTIMDLIVLGKKAVLVPTPQQPEQTILARQLQELRVAFCPDQQNFTLEKAIKEVGQYQGFSHFSKEEGLLESAVRRLLS
jgi:predicted glycosyltransferase